MTSAYEPVRSVAEAAERLAATPEGRTLMAHYVAVQDLEQVIRGAPGVSAETCSQVIAGIRSYTGESDGASCYLVGMILAELREVIPDKVGFNVIIRAVRDAGDRLPVIAHPGLTLH